MICFPNNRAIHVKTDALREEELDNIDKKYPLATKRKTTENTVIVSSVTSQLDFRLLSTKTKERIFFWRKWHVSGKFNYLDMKTSIVRLIVTLCTFTSIALNKFYWLHHENKTKMLMSTLIFLLGMLIYHFNFKLGSK